ncbi:unnamed protein product [Lymnaea stagnalis]|uniref:Uncharacterized protein n=1 Tax=Lymnaea stagnalis TaxID=6523 RepID=A0AAV2HQ15_LYMST
MESIKSDILTFIRLAKKGEQSRKLRGLIEHVSPKDVTSWRDEDGLDVMHHVILGDNAEVVTFMLQRGFFVRPHIPEVAPYCHLAALLGERTLLQVLLQYRPDDYFPSLVPLRLPAYVVHELNGNQHQPNGVIPPSVLRENSSSNSSASSSSSSSFMTSTKHYQTEPIASLLENLKRHPNTATSPLDIAARAGHLECVRVILNQCVLKRHADDTLVDKSDVLLACLADHPLSLTMLVESQAPTRQEWEHAVEDCLHHARAECLDVLLHLGRETKHMFKSMNFYHVLFTYTSIQGVSSYPRLAQTTEVLVKHKHSVRAHVPCRTYPMYSLLTHAFCFHDYSNTQYYVKALRILLKHGADPCFDEVKFEKRHPKHAAAKIIGRSAYSSALHCLLETVENYSQYLESPALAVKFVEDCASVLMGGKADMNHVGHIGNSDKKTIQGTVLHQLAKSSVALGVNPAMVRCVLRHGADPSVKVDGKYAINVYFDQLFQKLSSPKVVDAKRKFMDDAMTMCRLCMFMNPSAIRECLDMFVRDHGRTQTDQVKVYVAAVKEELLKHSGQVHHLRDLSAWTVWSACGRTAENVRALKIAAELKTFILPMGF